MRQIILDTETTGFNHKDGDRIIEIGCIELIDRKPTGNNYHTYINPERDSHEGALKVHGLTTQFLLDKPKFSGIVDSLVSYLNGAEIIAHNAPFDVNFLKSEFNRLNRDFSSYIGNIIDTKVLASQQFPGKKLSLDALCDKYKIDRTKRDKHGAIVDCELLSEVYLMLTRSQGTLIAADEVVEEVDSGGYADIIVVKASEEELTLHNAIMAEIRK